jgi:hypothetical protein
MDQARLEKYAGWLVQNKAKKGTPEFSKVAEAYKTLRSGAPDTTVKNWSDVPGAALNNAPESAGNMVKDIGNAIIHPIDTAMAIADTGAGALREGAKAVLPKAAFDAIDSVGTQDMQASGERASEVAKATGTHYKDRYGSSEALKQTLAKDPVGVVGDVAGVATGGAALAGKAGTVAKIATAVPKAIVSKAKALNKLKPDYPEAAPSVARQLKDLHESGGFNMDDLTEAKRGVDKAITDNRVIVKDHARVLNNELNPLNAVDDADKAVRLEWQKAFASDAHRAMDNATPDQIASVKKLVGHTKEGADLVMTLKKNVMLNKLRNKVQGGVSKFTDTLNPLSTETGRYGSKGLPGQILAATHFGNPLGLAAAAAQGGIVVGGRLTDMATGRRSLPKKFIKDFAKDPEAPSDPSLIGVADNKRAADATAAKAAEDAAATRAATKEAADLAKNRAIAKKALDASTKVSDKAEVTVTRKAQAEVALKARGQALALKEFNKSAKDVSKAEAAVAKDFKAQEASAAKAAQATEAKAAAKKAAETKALEKAAKDTEAKAAAAKKKAEQDSQTLADFETKQKQAFLAYKPKAERIAAEAPKLKKGKKNEVVGKIEKIGDHYYDEAGKMVDGNGKVVSYVPAFLAATENIKVLTHKARGVGRSLSSEKAKAAIDDALDELETAHGRAKQAEREAIVKKALSKAMTIEQHDAIWEALQPLADVFKLKD